MNKLMEKVKESDQNLAHKNSEYLQKTNMQP